MKRTLTVICGTCVWLALAGYADELRIVDFKSGDLSIQPCTTRKLYQVEWSPSLTPVSWSLVNPFQPIEATSSVVHASVPMFYRAIELSYTGLVYGVLYLVGTPVTNHPIHLVSGDGYATNATVRTGSFGEYSFSNVMSGRYVITLADRIGNTLNQGWEFEMRKSDVRVDLHVTGDIQNTWPPDGGRVSTNQPLFTWPGVGVPGVTYSIAVYDTNWNIVAYSETYLPQHRFTNELQHGETYIWEVYATLETVNVWWRGRPYIQWVSYHTSFDGFTVD